MNGQRRILFLLMTMVIWISFAGVSYGDIIINAPMTTTDSTGWVLGGSPTSSLLTGNGTIDSSGSGWLRLTDNSASQTGYAYNTTTFDLSQGLLIQFDYATWGGSGADGYSIYLFDAGVSTFNIGAFGGSLGYAQKTGIAGISGGYAGIGIDEYGNFSNPSEGRYLGPGAYPNTVTIRGTVVGFGSGAVGQTTSTTSYPWIATSSNNGSLWYNGTTRPDQTSTNYRRVIIQISPVTSPSSAPTANVWIQFGYNTTPVQMITSASLPTILYSQQLMVGYAASTGASTNYHEIRSLLVTNAGTTTSINLGITKSVLDTTTSSSAITAVGDGIRYTLTARNYGPNNVTATGVGIVDNIPTTITGVTWTCAVVSGSPSGTSCGAASGSGNTLNTTANLPYGGAVTYTINGTVGTSAPSTISNTATLVIPSSVTDYNSTDNSATVSIPVTSNLSTSTKTVVDTTSADRYYAGDTLQYTITLNESSGAAASGVSVSDTIDTTNLTWSSIVSCPSGATCSYSSGVLSVTGISIPANGSVTIIYAATISSSTAVGTTISNTATVTNPNGTGASAVAPVVTVYGSTISAGNKPLYLIYDTSTTGHLSRTPSAVTTNYVTIAKGSTTVSWALTPVLQSAVTISSGYIPIVLWMATNSARTYSIPVALKCGSATVASATLSAALTTTITSYTYNTSLSLASAYTCAAGNAWTLDITNTMTGGMSARDVRVYPAPSTSNYSKVTLASQSVINVNSISLYSAAYSGGSVVSSVAPGATVYIRTVVSDPFGYADISGATITITDSSGTVQLASTALDSTYLKASSGALKTYEYAYTVPSTGPAGDWSIKVAAAEGSEGTVTNTLYATMPVVITPVLTVVKSTDKTSVTSGSAITYTILVTNTSTGTAINATVTDPLPTYTTYVANSTTLNGITVAGDGSTSPLIAGLLVDNNSGRSAGVAATGVLPAGKSATITFQVTVK